MEDDILGLQIQTDLNKHEKEYTRWLVTTSIFSRISSCFLSHTIVKIYLRLTLVLISSLSMHIVANGVYAIVADVLVWKIIIQAIDMLIWCDLPYITDEDRDQHLGQHENRHRIFSKKQI